MISACGLDPGPGECDGDGRAAETEQPAPATPYWAALIRDQPAASAVTASTSAPVDSVSPTSPTPTDPATAGPVQVAFPPAAADEHADPADLVFVDLAGAAADDRLGILAGRALRDGGLLAVLTHCHHTVDHDRRIRHSRRGENVLGGDDCDRRDFDADGGACSTGRGWSTRPGLWSRRRRTPICSTCAHRHPDAPARPRSRT